MIDEPLERIRSGTYPVQWDQPIEVMLRDLQLSDLSPMHCASAGWFGPLTSYIVPMTDVTDIALSPSGSASLTVSVLRRSIPYWIPDIPNLHPTWGEWVQQTILWRVGRTQAFENAMERGAMAVEGSFVHNHVGVRFVMTRPPVTPAGPTVVIRLLPHTIAPQLDSYVNNGALSSEAVQVLQQAFAAKGTFLIAGSTGSGKTTFASALLMSGQATGDRYVVIEDTEEIGMLPNGISMVVPDGFDVEQAFVQGIRAALRMRPNRIVVGEVRGAEAAAIIHAAMTGHPVVATIHGTDAAGAVDQLLRYASRAPSATPTYVRSTLAGSVKATPWIIVMMERLRVTTIAEILPFGGQSERIPLNILFTRDTLDAPLRKVNAPQGGWAVQRRERSGNP